MRSPRILILGAWEPEIAPLRPLARTLGRRTRGPKLVLDTVGVGLVDAALGTVAALEKADLVPGRGDVCLFVGTAGLYGGRKARAKSGVARSPSLGAAVLARRVHLASAAAVRSEGYWPPPLVRQLDCALPLREALQTARPLLPVVDVATSLAITTAPALARRLSATLAEADLPLVENLEAFAVARTCAQRQVPFGAVMGLSNTVGPRAHEEWKRLAQPASQDVAAVLASWLA